MKHLFILYMTNAFTRSYITRYFLIFLAFSSYFLFSTMSEDEFVAAVIIAVFQNKQ